MTKPRTRKPNSNRKLNKLSPAQRGELRVWLIGEGLSYEAANARILKRFGISVAASALTKFWDEECAPRIIRVPIASDLFVEVTIRREADGAVRMTVTKGTAADA